MLSHLTLYANDAAQYFEDEDLRALLFIQKGNTLELEQMIESGYKIKKLEFKLLNEAVIYDRLEVLKKLIGLGLNPLEEYDKLMSSALIGNKTQVAQFFFDLNEEKALDNISHYLSKHFNRPAPANDWCMEKISIRAIEKNKVELEKAIPFINCSNTLSDSEQSTQKKSLNEKKKSQIKEIKDNKI